MYTQKSITHIITHSFTFSVFSLAFICVSVSLSVSLSPPSFSSISFFTPSLILLSFLVSFPLFLSISLPFLFLSPSLPFVCFCVSLLLSLIACLFPLSHSLSFSVYIFFSFYHFLSFMEGEHCFMILLLEPLSLVAQTEGFKGRVLVRILDPAHQMWLLMSSRLTTDRKGFWSLCVCERERNKAAIIKPGVIKHETTVRVCVCTCTEKMIRSVTGGNATDPMCVCVRREHKTIHGHSDEATACHSLPIQLPNNVWDYVTARVARSH